MNRFVLSVGILLSAASLMSVEALAAEKYRGTWTGGSSTSLEIRSAKPLIVRYCFSGDCNLYEPSGSEKSMTIRFQPRGDFPGAKLTFKKSGETYKGRYKRRGEAEVYTATLTK